LGACAGGQGEDEGGYADHDGHGKTAQWASMLLVLDLSTAWAVVYTCGTHVSAPGTSYRVFVPRRTCSQAENPNLEDHGAAIDVVVWAL
jgi:hypothetical protein